MIIIFNLFFMLAGFIVSNSQTTIIETLLNAAGTVFKSNTTLTISIDNFGSSNFEIDWGDGSIQTVNIDSGTIILYTLINF